MRSFQDQPLQNKIRGIIIFVSGLSLLLAFAAILIFQWSSAWEVHAKQLEVAAAIVSDQSAAALEFTQKPQAEMILSSLKGERQIVLAAIYDKQGELFASYVRADSAEKATPTKPQRDGRIAEAGELAISHPMSSEGERIGTFYLHSDMSAFWERLWVSVGVMGIVFVIAIALIIPISSWLGNWVTRPVLHLESVVQKVSEQRDYSLRAQKHSSDELGQLIDGFNNMLSKIQAQDQALAKAKDELEERVQERTKELEASNKEMQTFSYSVSHDLRSPLRAIDGFSEALLSNYNDKLDDMGRHYLQRIRAGSQRMADLIEGLLDLARISRNEIHRENVDLSQLANEIAQELQRRDPDRKVEFAIASDLSVNADSRLLSAAMMNLMGNSWKYSRHVKNAKIEFGSEQQNGAKVYFVRDNGAGFDMTYANKLFGVFQRLHTDKEFEGTGVGLATVQRTLQRHGGRIWAEGAVGKGATFYFTFDKERETR